MDKGQRKKTSVKKQEDDLATILCDLEARPNDYHLLRLLFRTLRDKALRRPDLVLTHAPKLLTRSSKLGNEVWTVREQYLLAALDSNKLSLAREILNGLKIAFPSSVRVARLTGMEEEARGHFEEALAIYNDILTNEPADSFSMKRRICIWKSHKETRTRAIEELNEYLTIFMGDVQAWQELADLYIDEQEYNYAAFCWEEILVADPLNHHYHTRYAEILYTLEDYHAARKYFAHSLELNKENNARALYGLCASCKAIGTQKGPKPKDNLEVYEWAQKTLRTLYKDNTSAEMYAKVVSVLNKLKP